MPLFLFISGYLLNVKKLSYLSWSELISKYSKRMLIYWLLSWMVYTFIICFENLTLKVIVRNFVYPYYHLWYVQTLFSMIIFIWILKKYVISRTYFYIICFSIGILCLQLPNQSIPPILRFHSLAYIVLGIYCNDNLYRINRGGMNIVVISILLLSLSYYLIKIPTFINLHDVILYPIIVILCAYGITPIIKKGIVFNRVTEFWGKYSLQIYLWHVIPILLIRYIFQQNLVMYYLFSTFLLLLFVGGSILCIKNKK